MITLAQWLFSGLLAILFVLLAAGGVSACCAAVFGRPIPARLSVAVVCTLYTFITWICYFHLAEPLTAILPWLLAFPLLGIAVEICKFPWRQRQFMRAHVKRSVAPFIEVALWFGAISLLYSFLAPDRRMPVLLTGNNDIWAYAKYTHLVLDQPTGNNIVGFNLLTSTAADQTPTAFLFLAAIAYYGHQSVISILSVGLMLALALSASFIASICHQIFRLPKLLSNLIASLWVVSSFISYLATNYFLAQIMAIGVFLVSLLVSLDESEGFFVQIALLTTLNYLLFMTYPALYVPYLGVLLLAQFARATVRHARLGDICHDPALQSLLISLPLSVVLIFLLDYSHAILMFARMLLLASAHEGWSLTMLNPIALMTLPTKDIFSNTLPLNILGYCGILIFVVVLMNRLNNVVSHRPERVAISVVFISAVAVYLLYYMLIGASYQQWKFAGSIVLPLGFLPIALAVSAFAGMGRFRAMFAVLLLVFGLVFNLAYLRHAVAHTSIREYAPLSRLESLDNASNITDIVVDLKGDFEGTMIAEQYLNHIPIVVRSVSYFSSDLDGSLPLAGPRTVTVTANCGLLDPGSIIEMGDSFCAFEGISKLRKSYSIEFNHAVPESFRLAGLSGIEPFGRWSDGHQVSIDIPVEMNWKGVDLTFAGIPFLPAGLRQQRMLISVPGRAPVEFDITSAGQITFHVDHGSFLQNHLLMTFELPDAVSPKAFGSDDSRVLGFGFSRMQVRAVQ